MGWREDYQAKLCSPEEAVKIVKSGDAVYVGSSTSFAGVLCEALYERKNELENVTIGSGLTMKAYRVFQESAGSPFRIVTYFAGPAEREAMKHGNCHYTSRHLSRLDDWVNGVVKPTVAFLDVSEPDEEGYVSFGASGVTLHDEVVRHADRLVLQVNRQAPYVYGFRNKVHISAADLIVEAESAPATIANAPITEDVRQISDYIAEMIPDGAVIQLGLGSISGAIGFALEGHSDLGIHSELLTDSMVSLMKKGVVTNRKKNFMTGKAVVGFSMGSSDMYDYINRNPNFYFAPFSYVNDPAVIAKNDNMISVNTAMSVDLYGQTAADNLGGRQQSGCGGQIDYVRGAQMSKGGKSFIALTSTINNKKGRSSRIVAAFPPGTAVTTARNDVQYMVTEFGCVNLKNLTMDERVKAMISIAHPDFRQQLWEEAKQYKML